MSNLNLNVNFGSISKFNSGDDWDLHSARLEQYFNWKSIDDDVQKKSILLLTIGQDAYRILIELCDNAMPRTYDELCAIMKNHFAPELSVFQRRKQFSNLKQFNTETISEWYKNLVIAANLCDFGDQLEERIKEQFVTGMRDGKISEVILKGSHKMATKDIVDIALKIEGEDFCPIERLPEECLINIFEHLPVVDLIRIERVNQTWQDLSKQSWSKFKKLKIDPKFLGMKPFGTRHEFPEISPFLVQKTLKRAGRYIRKINTSSDCKLAQIPCILPLIAEYCPGIKSINCKVISVNGLDILSESCENIVKLEFDRIDLTQDYIEVLEKLFLNNKNLEVVRFYSFNGNGSFLLKLPLDKIKEVQINCIDLNFFNQNSINQTLSCFIEKTEKLNTFSFHHAQSSLISALSSSCHNLTSLNLTCESIIDKIDDHLSQKS